jgi:hypothetical protein
MAPLMISTTTWPDAETTVPAGTRPSIGLVPGMLGLLLSSVHGAPGYYASILRGVKAETQRRDYSAQSETGKQPSVVRNAPARKEPRPKGHQC